MSKSKPKDKKNDNQSLAQKELDEKRRQILQATFTIRKLQQRLDRIVIDNKQLVQKYQQNRNSSQQQIQKLKSIIDSKQAEINELLTKSSLAEIENKQKEARIRKLENHLNQEIDRKNKEYDNLKQASISDIKTLENKLKEFEIYMSEKEEMDKDRTRLRQQLELERAEKIRELADKDREKVQATDKLKNDMLHKIQQTKTSLLSLKKQQLSTTTRLTVLQNHQLTSELEYQSKQTQKLLFKNEQLQNKVVNLQRDLEIHKQVEQELAKRSHFSRGIIKKLSQRVKELQEGAEHQKCKTKHISEMDVTEIRRRTESNNKDSTTKDDKKKSEIIYAMEKNIENLQKNYSKLQSDFDVLKNQNYYMQTRLEEHQSKIQKIGTLLVKYTEDIFDGVVEVKDDNYSYDLRHLKKTDVKDWSKQDIALTVNVLLAHIKPLLTKKNVAFVIPGVKKNVNIVDDDENASMSPISLPKIHGETNERKTQIKSRLNDLPINIATKIVGSSLREWGKPVIGTSSSSINLSRKYKVGELPK